MIFVYDSCDCYEIAVGVLWYCCGIDVGSLWDLCEISRGIVGECCDLAMVLSWSCCVIPVVFLWYCCGITVYGVAVEMLWYYDYIVAVLMWIPVGLMWNFPWHCWVIAVKLLGDYWDIIIMMVLLWDCLGIAVILLCDSCDCCGIVAGCLM